MKVFDHLDKDDYQARFEDDRVLVSRSSLMVSFLIAQTTRDYWEFRFKQIDEARQEVALSRGNVHLPNLDSSGLQDRHFDTSTQSRLAPDHDRLEYFLGVRRDWPECEAYKMIGGEKAYPYCGQDFMDDRRPL